MGIPDVVEEFRHETVIHLGWTDWLRVLFGRPIHVALRNKVRYIEEGQASRIEGERNPQATVWVESIRKPKPLGGYEPTYPKADEQPQALYSLRPKRSR